MEDKANNYLTLKAHFQLHPQLIDLGDQCYCTVSKNKQTDDGRVKEPPPKHVTSGIGYKSSIVIAAFGRRAVMWFAKHVQNWSSIFSPSQRVNQSTPGLKRHPSNEMLHILFKRVLTIFQGSDG